MSNKRYRKFMEAGDESIPKYTAYRYRHVISPFANPVQDSNVALPVYQENIENVFQMNSLLDMDIPIEQIIASKDLKNDLEKHLYEILINEKLHTSSQTSQNFNSLEEMINSPDFFEPIPVPVNKSKGELFLMGLKYCIANNTSVSGMEHLFKLINTTFEEPILPNSRYLIDKLLNNMDKVEFHGLCLYCAAYIGKFGEIEHVKQCSSCEMELDLKNSSDTSFFVLIDPSSQIKDLISMHEDHYEYVLKERVHKTNHLNDVYDGTEYRKFVRSLSEQERFSYLSAVFNTDGANKFECSQYSIWPLYIMINELPKQERMDKLITCGLWFNKEKPDMNIFLGCFVDMVNRLTKDGISCILRGEERILKLYIISCCVDSVARPSIQGIKQFNGKYGCSWCLHPGTWVDDALKYTLLVTPIDAREHADTINAMMSATPACPINGVKCPSAFVNLPSFNIISGFVPDYMHCCLEGVAKQITEYHVSLMNTNDITEIDLKISNITAPHQIAKLSRPISKRKQWKAREWENYVLYYSPVVLLEHLSRKHYYHWLLFVESLYILLQDNIHIIELKRANEMLHKFVFQTEQYFEKKAMTYNVHQLLHLAESVMNWGPLWCHSTFSFESGNHDLLKAIKCSKGVTHQIIRYININHCVKVLTERSYPNVCELVKKYCDDILGKLKIQSFCKLSDATYFGKGNAIDDLTMARFNVSESAKLYCKAVKYDCLFESSSITKRRSNNSFVLLKDNRFAQINKFIVDDVNLQELVICNFIRTRNSNTQYYKMLKVIEEIEINPIAIAISEIKTICICMNILDNMYIIALPNLLHY